LAHPVGTFNPHEQQGAPTLQMKPSAAPNMQGIKGVAPLQQNSSLMQRHSETPEHPMNLPKSVEINELQHGQPANTSISEGS
jgi:hypothetical protein